MWVDVYVLLYLFLLFIYFFYYYLKLEYLPEISEICNIFMWGLPNKEKRHEYKFFF